MPFIRERTVQSPVQPEYEQRPSACSRSTPQSIIVSPLTLSTPSVPHCLLAMADLAKNEWELNRLDVIC